MDARRGLITEVSRRDSVNQGDMMKASNNRVTGKFHERKGKIDEKVRKLNDPTLEGKDENKVGRIQRTLGRAQKAI